MLSTRNRLTCLLFSVVVCFNLAISADQQFSQLAESFIQGKTHFLTRPEMGLDTVFFEGKYYWPLGPFPAVLLLPFVLVFQSVGLFFRQGYLQIVLVFGIYYSFFKIARRVDYGSDDAGFLAFAFCFASAFLGVGIFAVIK